jgi:hypothetical protein
MVVAISDGYLYMDFFIITPFLVLSDLLSPTITVSFDIPELLLLVYDT